MAVLNKKKIEYALYMLKNSQTSPTLTIFPLFAFALNKLGSWNHVCL